MLVPFLIILALVLINALYVAAEFAAVSASRPKIKQLADEGNVSAQRLLPVLGDVRSLDRYVAACQVGITLSSLVLGAYGQDALSGLIAPFFDDLEGFETEAAGGTAAVVILIILTAFQLVLGELLPKSIALQYPIKTLLNVSHPMSWSLKLLHPFIQLLNGSGHLILRMFGMSQTPHRHVHSADEMQMLISESHEGGLIETEEHERLSQALQLENRKVSEIMIPRSQIKALNVSANLDSILQSMGETPFTRWPVYEGTLDQIIGIAHARDIARLALDPSKPFELKKVIRKPLTVHAGMTTDDLLSVMRIEHKQLAIVINEYGTPIGLVGISDVLDELMGDIQETQRTRGVAL